MATSSIRSRGSEAIALIAGTSIIAFALYQSHRRPEYDPTALVGTGVGLITLVWMTPTGRVDEKIEDIVQRVDKEL